VIIYMRKKEDRVLSERKDAALAKYLRDRGLVDSDGNPIDLE